MLMGSFMHTGKTIYESFKRACSYVRFHGLSKNRAQNTNYQIFQSRRLCAKFLGLFTIALLIVSFEKTISPVAGHASLLISAITAKISIFCFSFFLLVGFFFQREVIVLSNYTRKYKTSLLRDNKLTIRYLTKIINYGIIFCVLGLLYPGYLLVGSALMFIVSVGALCVILFFDFYITGQLGSNFNKFVKTPVAALLAYPMAIGNFLGAVNYFQH